MLETIFWTAAFLMFYTYIGYPVTVALLARLWPSPVRQNPIQPTVSFLIVAHNEAKVIRQKLTNCLALDYSRERLEIVMASDGSTDGTVEIAKGYEPQGVTVIAFGERRGKPTAFNDVIPQCSGEIVVLSDARQMYEPSALAALVANFADTSVGAVSGELHLINEDAASISQGLGLYWRYEKFIRRQESRIDSTVGATGAIYAIRRELFEPIPTDTLLDDVLIPMRIVRRGYRVVFEPRARAFDRVASESREEFTRKVRTIAGNLQLFIRERWLWSAWQNRLWWQAMSHKVLRLLGPFLLGGMFITSALLAVSSGVQQLALISQLLFYAAGLGGSLCGRKSAIGRLFSIPHAFCLLNLTTLISILRFLRKSQAVTWEKAAEPAGSHRSIGL